MRDENFAKTFSVLPNKLLRWYEYAWELSAGGKFKGNSREYITG